jgi:hypothetical protein
MENLGDGILSSKELQEINMLNDLAGKTKNIISGYEGKFKTGCDDIIEKSIK